MADQTNIEWCDATFNPWIGCTRVSIAANGGGGCDHCYAAVSTPARAMHVAWGAFDIACRRIEQAYKQRPLFDVEPARKPEQMGLDVA